LKKGYRVNTHKEKKVNLGINACLLNGDENHELNIYFLNGEAYTTP
jgi:hypothetical protein